MNYCETLYPLRKHFSLISTSQHEFERKMPQLCGSAFTSSPFFLIFLISPSPSWVGDYDNVFSRETPCARTKNYKILTHFSRFLSLSYSVHVMKNYHFFFSSFSGLKLATGTQTNVLTFQVSVTQFLLSLGKKLTFRRYEKLATNQRNSVSIPTL